jgi:hypothetical protein
MGDVDLLVRAPGVGADMNSVELAGGEEKNLRRVN